MLLPLLLLPHLHCPPTPGQKVKGLGSFHQAGSQRHPDLEALAPGSAVCGLGRGPASVQPISLLYSLEEGSCCLGMMGRQSGRISLVQVLSAPGKGWLRLLLAYPISISPFPW
jgi:hypothetical protein